MEIALLEDIRYSNEVRAARAREWIGGMYLLVAYMMLQFVIAVALITSYVLPLRRFSTFVPLLANQKAVTIFYTLLLAALFFLSSTTGGFIGFIVVGALLVIWSIALVAVAAVRRWLHHRREAARLERGHETDPAANESEAFFGEQVPRDVASYALKPPHAQVAFATPQRGADPSSAGNVASPTDGALAAIEPAESTVLDPGDGAALDAGPNQSGADFPTPSRGSLLRSGGVSGKTGRGGEGRRRMRGMYRWAYCPERLSTTQLACFVSSVLLLLTALMVLFIVLYSWRVRDYELLSRDGTRVAELQPPLRAKALQLMYAFPGLATRLKLDVYARLVTEQCGRSFRTELPASRRRREIKEKWIDTYAVNMSLFDPSDYSEYSSVNAWLSRAIDLSHRPLPVGAEIVVAPADCRMLVYSNPVDLRVWTKGYEVIYNDLLENEIVSDSRRYFDNGAIVVARLAPQDYHRFHAPVSGTIVSIRRVDGTFWSSSADAARSGNGAFLNARTVIVLDAGPRVGLVAFLGVGATCTGSVVVEGAGGRELRVGSVVERGEQLGFFQFGGSTVIVLFAQGRVLFDNDLLTRSRFGVETLLNVRQGIGSTR